MRVDLRRRLFGAVALSLCLAAPLGCEKTRADTKTPEDERGGAGADGNNSAPESLSNGGADPDKMSLTEPSTSRDTPSPPTGDAASGSTAPAGPSSPSPK